MALKIRLRQQGNRNRLSYRIVVTDTHAPRDGKFVEMIGYYDPHVESGDRHLTLKNDRVQHWIDQGAEPSETAASLLAKEAPEVMKSYRDRLQARRVKATAKKRARRKAKAAA